MLKKDSAIRSIKIDDIEPFFLMLCELDRETTFMMYEPGERRSKAAKLDQLKVKIERAISGGDLLLVVENNEKKIVGFLWAQRGTLNRIQHTAYIVTGIRQAYRGQGIGTELFHRLDIWARDNGVVRLELTVECPNTIAKHLYEKQGFVVEGRRPKSMKVDGVYVDEFYMGKILRS